jgi:hypothetical protein
MPDVVSIFMIKYHLIVGYWWFWLPFFPDILNPCNYFLWGLLKDGYQKQSVYNSELKQEVLDQ